MIGKLSSFINIKPIQNTNTIHLTDDNKETVIPGAKSKYFYNLLINRSVKNHIINKCGKGN